MIALSLQVFLLSKQMGIPLPKRARNVVSPLSFCSRCAACLYVNVPQGSQLLNADKAWRHGNMSLGCYADDSSQTKTIKHSFAAKNSSLCAFVVAVSVCWRSISLDRATKAPVFYFSSHHYRSSTSQLLLLLQTDSFIVHRKMERPQSNSESGDHQSGNLSQTLWLLGDINTECPCERNCGPECFFQLLKEVTK